MASIFTFNVMNYGSAATAGGPVSALEAGKRAGAALTKMIVYIVVYVIVAAAVQFFMTMFHVMAYFKYVNAILILAFGW